MLVRLTGGWVIGCTPQELSGLQRKRGMGEDHLPFHSWVDVILPLSVSREGVFLSLHSQSKTGMAPWKNHFTSQYSKAFSVWNVTFHKRFCMYSESISSVQFSSVTQLCPTLCDPINCSTPGLPVHHQLLEFTPTHIHWVGDAIQPSHPLLPPFSSWPQSLPASGSFPMSQLFPWGGQSIGVSASTSVPPMNTQDWSPLGWTGWIFLQSKGLSRVFSNTTVQKH